MAEFNDTKTDTVAELNEPKEVRFLKCIGCPDMGMTCLGANLLMLSLSELKKWVRIWKVHYDLSIEACAEIWNGYPIHYSTVYHPGYCGLWLPAG